MPSLSDSDSFTNFKQTTLLSMKDKSKEFEVTEHQLYISSIKHWLRLKKENKIAPSKKKMARKPACICYRPLEEWHNSLTLPFISRQEICLPRFFPSLLFQGSICIQRHNAPFTFQAHAFYSTPRQCKNRRSISTRRRTSIDKPYREEWNANVFFSEEQVIF